MLRFFFVAPCGGLPVENGRGGAGSLLFHSHNPQTAKTFRQKGCFRKKSVIFACGSDHTPAGHIFSEGVSLILFWKSGKFLCRGKQQTLTTCVDISQADITAQVWGFVYFCKGFFRSLQKDKRRAPHFLFLLHRGAPMRNPKTDPYACLAINIAPQIFFALYRFAAHSCRSKSDSCANPGIETFNRRKQQSNNCKTRINIIQY